MKNYSNSNGYIYYDYDRVFALDTRRNDADTICEIAQNIHQYLLENADISLLERNEKSIFDINIFSCPADDFHYIMDMFAELNQALKDEPDDDDYFIFNQSPVLFPCFGDILVKWDFKSHAYICYDMGIMDLCTIHDLLVFA